MPSIQQWFGSLRFGSSEPDRAAGVGRKITLMRSLSLALIALLAVTAFLLLDEAIRVHRESATAIGLTDRQRMMSQRIASLAAGYALGNISARGDLRAAITDLESAHQSANDRAASGGPRFADADPVIGDLARARQLAALSPRDPALAGRAAALLAAQQPLLDAFDAELHVNAERASARLGTLRMLGVAVCALVPATLFGVFFAIFRSLARRIAGLVRDARELAEHATVDPLTGMLNKRSFQARGAIEINKARRYGRPLSLLMIDADQLSAIEDRHGRDGGDTVLRALTSSFFGATRISDLVAHVDADQFAILLPETSCEGAQLLAERLRHKISALTVEINRMPVTCTISVGVAAAEKDASFLWPTFKRADEALYEAKMRGRNRVVVAAAA